jgi:hypothetical protein
MQRGYYAKMLEMEAGEMKKNNRNRLPNLDVLKY